MATNYPKGSMGSNDARNQKLAAVIYILGFAALHALAFFIPAVNHFHGWRIPLFIVATAAVIWLVSMFWRNADLTEDFGWPEGVVIILAAASAISIGYCPTC